MTGNQPYRYELAISFACEDRGLAKFIASTVRPDFAIFYDEYEASSLWRADLSIALPENYINSRFCIILQSEEYLERMWTTLERQAIIGEFLKRRGRDYVLPIRVRGCTSNIPGISPLTGYITIDAEGEWPKVVKLLKMKLNEKP